MIIKCQIKGYGSSNISGQENSVSLEIETEFILHIMQESSLKENPTVISATGSAWLMRTGTKKVLERCSVPCEWMPDRKKIDLCKGTIT